MKKRRSTRQPYLPKDESKRLEVKLHEHLLAGGNIKSFVIDHSRISTQWAYVHAREMGWHSQMILDGEFADLLISRKRRPAA